MDQITKRKIDWCFHALYSLVERKNTTDDLLDIADRIIADETVDEEAIKYLQKCVSS